MEHSLQELERSPGVVEIAKQRHATCFLCRYIVEDLEQNKKFTGYPKDWGGAALFPVEGKLKHLLLEIGAPLPPPEAQGIETLASAVLVALLASIRSN